MCLIGHSCKYKYRGETTNRQVFLYIVATIAIYNFRSNTKYASIAAVWDGEFHTVYIRKYANTHCMSAVYPNYAMQVRF